MNPASDTRGFTLVSVILAIVLLSFGLLAMARTQSLLAVVTHDTGNRGTAVMLASRYLEELRTRDPWTLASEPPATVNASGQASPSGPFTRSTVVTLDNNNLVRVQVVVRYPRGTGAITIETLIFRT